MRTIYVVTHAEATHHAAGLVGGWFDSDLTPRGHGQAAAVAERVRHLIPAAATVELYASELRRAAQTAEAIGERLGISALYLHGLREKSYGVAEGRAQRWLDKRFVPPPKTGDRMNHFEGIDGAETKHAFAVRVYDAVGRILASTAEHQVIVTHGFALTFVVAAFTRLPLDSTSYLSFRADAGGITVLREDDFFHNRTIVSLNETEHLNEVAPSPPS